MSSLTLTLRGIRWRRGTSGAVLAIAVIATAGAALGPLYAHSAAESLVRQDLALAAPVSTGIQARAAVAGQTQFTPADLVLAVDTALGDPSLDPWYRPGTMALTVLNGAPSVDGDRIGLAQVSWYRGQCGSVTVVSGSCPSSAGQAMVSALTAELAGIDLGDEMQLGITSDPAADRVTVVGTYDPDTIDPAVWGLAQPGQFRPPAIEGQPDRLDEVVVDEATMLGSRGDMTAVGFRALEAGTVSLSEVPALRAAVEAVTAVPDVSTSEGPRVVLESDLPDFFDAQQPELDSLYAASFAVTAQLVLLAWFVLFLMISATSDERSGEIALAKLRGMSPRATVLFGLAEPVLLLVVAAPIGLAIALAVDRVLTQQILTAGTQVVLTPATLAATAVCFLGGAVAAALAARGILTAPLLDQLRRTGGGRGRLIRSAAVDAVAIALAVAGVYQLQQGRADVLALLAPGLIALAAGLLAVRVLPLLARGVVRRTRGSRRLASFLSSRNIARRPAGLRIVVLLSLAVGLAVFAVDGWLVASANRDALARAEVGAAEVLHVRAESPGALLAAVEAADPGGTQAMGAVAFANGEGGLLAVTAERLGAVAAWDPAWVGSSSAGIGPLLHPPSPATPLVVRGPLDVEVDYAPGDGDARVLLGLAVRSSDALPHEVTVAELRPGASTYRVDLPMCIDQPCSITAFTLTQPVDTPSSSLSASLTLGVADADGVVDLAPWGAEGWRSGASSIAFPIASGAEVTAAADGQLSVAFELDGAAGAAIEVADHPSRLPVIQGTTLAAQQQESAVVTGLDGRFIPIDPVGSGVLPRLLRSGTLADLPYALAAMGRSPGQLDYQVWLSGDAAPSVRAGLEEAGLTIGDVESIEQRSSELDQGGAALALRLFLIAAVVALALGASTLLANAYVIIRRRAYELAALRALGAPRSALVRAGRREQVVLAFTGVALGAVSGLVAAGLAIPSLLGPATTDGPPPWYGPAWIAVAALIALVLVLLAVVADVGARRTTHRAVPELLRQVQE